MKKIKLLTALIALSLIATSCGGAKGASSSIFNSSSSSSESSESSGKDSSKDSSHQPSKPSSSSLPSSSSSNKPSSSSIAPKKYTVTWKNSDGLVLETDFDVVEGTTPTYDGNTPVKDADAQYNYVFNGWTPEVSPVRSDIEYVATYKEELRKYTVIWKDEDGSVLETDNNVPYGTTPTFDGNEPSKESTDQYDYSFAGWSTEIEAVTGDAEYTATYQEALRKYLVTWKDEDGTVLDSKEVEYGETPVYEGVEPSKESTVAYQYKFDGWSPNIVPVTGEVEYIATYKEENRKYTVSWVNYDGTVLATEEYEYLSTPSYSGETPTKVNDHGIAYNFAGWTPEILPVEGDQTYTATYEGVPYFSFEQISYELKEGAEHTSLKGSPWINSNYQGELKKIKKPSPKDDFYAAMNYDTIMNGGIGPFEIGSARASNAINSFYYGTAKTTNSEYLYAVFNKLFYGDATSVRNYLDALDLNTYFGSKEAFLSPSSFLKLEFNGSNYEVVYNDGYINGNVGLNTCLFYGAFDDYQQYNDYSYNIIAQLGETFNFNTDNMYDAGNIIQNLSVHTYNNYYNYGDQMTSYTVNNMPWEPVKKALLDVGFRGTKRIYIKYYVINTLNYLFNDYLKNDPDVVKTAVCATLGFDYRFLMGPTEYRKLNRYLTQTQLFSRENNLYNSDDSHVARSLLNAFAPELMEQVYIELEGNPEIKNTVSDLIDDILEGYDELVSGIDWLSDTTKSRVLKKLRKMTHASCYSDVYRNFDKIDDSDLDVATLFELIGRYNNVIFDRAYNKVEADPFDWAWQAMPSSTVNAFYTNQHNAFVILNGVARGFVNGDESIEELYGKIGFVIGHEITHAFDSNGSHYD